MHSLEIASLYADSLFHFNLISSSFMILFFSMFMISLVSFLRQFVYFAHCRLRWRWSQLQAVPSFSQFLCYVSTGVTGPIIPNSIPWNQFSKWTFGFITLWWQSSASSFFVFDVRAFTFFAMDFHRSKSLFVKKISTSPKIVFEKYHPFQSVSSKSDDSNRFVKRSFSFFVLLLFNRRMSMSWSDSRPSPRLPINIAFGDISFLISANRSLASLIVCFTIDLMQKVQMSGFEPESSTWQADVLANYTTSAILELPPEIESSYLHYKGSASPTMLWKLMWP